MNTFKRLIPLLYLLTGCSETAVQLHIQPAPTAGGLDSICLQLAARNSFQFGRRYLIGGSTEELTFTVIAGESSSFEVLLTGRRRGQNVAQLRRRIAFESGAISDEPLVLAECGGTASSGTFSWVQRLTDQPGAAAAGVPSPFLPARPWWPGRERQGALPRSRGA